MTKRTSKGTRALLEEMGNLGDFATTVSEIAGKGIKVVSIVLDRIRPDPAQPRRVLPEPIRSAFLAGHINARQALEQWEGMVFEEAARLGRPRPDWRALLDRNPEDRSEDALEIDSPGQPGPEEELLRSIVATAATIRYGGQVSPITIALMDNDSYYRIETGERRYWAHHWLNMWLSEGFDQIQCIIVDNASPWRQAAENTSREGLSAMALARQLATLLLNLYEIYPDYSRPISNNWYRQALQYRVPRGEGENLRAALGGMQRSQFSRVQALLRLSDAVWELADRYRLEEKRLRYVLKLEDENQQLQLVRAMITDDLSSEQVQVLVESIDLQPALNSKLSGSENPGKKQDTTARIVNRWSALAKQIPSADLNLVAERWIEHQSSNDVLEQVAALRRLLDIVEKQVDLS